MQHRQLGRSGLKVSPFTLGSMEFGSKTTEPEAQKIFSIAIERGINIVDTANCYAQGQSEKLVGKFIAPHRNQILLATKFAVPMDENNPNSGGTSRHNIIQSCEASLKRLNTDHIDIFYIHRPFLNTPIDETLRALDDLVSSGKVRAIGSSSFASWQLIEAQWCADVKNLIRITAEQTPYHLLDRRIERELVPAAQSHGVGLTIWSPLAGGLLTGKYAKTTTNPRLTADDAWGAKHFTAQADDVMQKLASLAKSAGHTLTELALAWTLSRPNVSSIVLGPRNTSQFKQQLKALDVTLTAETLTKIDKIVPFGSVTVPYYLDDQFADFSPNLHHW